MNPADPEDPPRLGLIAVRGVLEPARVLGRDAAGRVVIAQRGAAPRAVSRDRLYWIGATPVPDAAALDAAWARLSDLAARADLAGAWASREADPAVAADEDPAAVARAALGSDAPEARDAVAVAVFGDNLHFRVRQRRLVREAAEAVARTLAAREAEAADRRRFLLAHAALAARLGAPPPADVPSAPDAEVEAAARAYLDALVERAAHGEDAPRAADADAILAALGRPSDGAFDLLVALGEFHPDENLSLRRAGLRRAFPADVLADADAAVAAAAARVERPPLVDLRDLLTVAIDDAQTTEVDDAFAVDGDRVYVFIADLGALVRPGSLVDREAARRVTTVYLPEGKLPMLPPALGIGASSLRAGVDRTALTFAFEVRDDGSLAGLEVFRARVRVNAQVDYSRADEYVRSVPRADDDDRVGPLLRRVAAAMDAHRDRRARGGGVFLQRAEVALEVGADGVVTRTPGDPWAPGRQLVSELMIATCAAAAELCVEQDIPCIFRSQARPDGGGLPLGGRVDGVVDQLELLRRLKPAVLGTRAAAHYTLGVGAYCQLTSPIRRYVDLLMHQQLTGWLKHGRPPLTAGQLTQAFPEIERVTSLARRVESDSRRYWGIRWLEQHPGHVLAGTVLREVGRRWLVELPELALQVPVNLPRRPVPGQAVHLAVARADARADRLQLRLVD